MQVMVPFPVSVVISPLPDYTNQKSGQFKARLISVNWLSANESILSASRGGLGVEATTIGLDRHSSV